MFKLTRPTQSTPPASEPKPATPQPAPTAVASSARSEIPASQDRIVQDSLFEAREAETTERPASAARSGDAHRTPPVEPEAEFTTFWSAVEQRTGAIQEPTAQMIAESVRPDDSVRYRFLGELLANAAHLSDDEIRSALVEQERTFEKIGEILIRRGKVTASQVDDALKKQKEVRSLKNVLRTLGLRVNHIRSTLMRIEGREEPIQQVMRDTGYLSEEDVALAVAMLSGMQYFKQARMYSTKFAEMIERGVELKRYAGFAPVALLDDGTLCVALEHVDARNDAHNHFDKWPSKRYVIASGSTLQKIFCNHFSKTEEQLLEMLKNAEASMKNRKEEEGFVRNLIGTLLRHGCFAGASDIHLKESPCVATMSMRFDGVLKDIAFYSLELHQRLNTQLRTDNAIVNGGANATGISAMQEGAITFEKDPVGSAMFKDVFERYGFRVQLGITLNDTKSAVIRILDKQGATTDLNSLGFDDRTKAIIDRNIHAPDGMILLVGPTGSGKTTSLYAAIEEIDPEEFSIQTIENPVEVPHGKWMQFQVAKRDGLSEGAEMAAIFKGQMRNDPDVILVGEIRDADVADTAIQAAKTGHIVFSTLHVTRASAVLTRLIGLSVEPQDVADTLRLVIAQRLVRKLCNSCAQPDTRETTLRKFERPLKGFLSDVKSPMFRMACDGGCKECRFTGYRGRTMVYEVMEIDQKLREMIESGAKTSEIEAHAIPEGTSMYELGMRHVANGMTSIDELVRAVTDTTRG